MPAGEWELAARATRGVVSVPGSVDESGTFEIQGLPDGAWTVQGRAWGHREAFGGETTTTGGDEVVVPLERLKDGR